MFDFVRKMTLAGAGLAIMTTEKIQEIMDELVKKERWQRREHARPMNQRNEDFAKSPSVS